MSTSSRELVFLILQFLDEEKYSDTVHKLEQESGFFFSMKYFEDAVLAGEWDEVEQYLKGFTKVDDNRYSLKIFFEIRKQKYLEALDRRDSTKALDILVKDLKVFSAFNEDLFKQITLLLTLENFRENEHLSKYGDTKSARALMLEELKKLIEANPLFRDKLLFPNLKNARLRTLINQSLNWQHQQCQNPKPNPDIKTLFTDHSCSPQQSNGPNAHMASPALALMNIVPKPGLFPQLGAHGPYQPVVATALSGWMVNTSSIPHPTVSGGPLGLATPLNPATHLKRPRSPPASTPAVDSENVLKRRALGVSEELGMPSICLPHGFPTLSRSFKSPDELPRTVGVILNQGSSVMSMDFHPTQTTLLLVGTNVGDIAVWEVASRERLVFRNFKVWDLQACSVPLQSSLLKDPAVSVNQVKWNHDGSRCGVAYSKHIVHIYTFNGRDNLIQCVEIEAHVGGVNDLAFSTAKTRPCVLTCGDDKTIKVWDVVNGAVQYTFEGHEAPVCSICPHTTEHYQFIFSTSLDGKIKVWVYDNGGSKLNFDAPGRWCTTIAYSADGTRLFSCGTSEDGDSYIVEWNEREGSIKRTYAGLRKRVSGVVQFDTMKSQYIAAGDEFLIKFWDMDNTNILVSTDAEGGLLPFPRIRFNKVGSLLAVSTSDNCIKILANADGLQLLHRPSLASDALTKTMIISPLGSVGATSGSTIAVADCSASVATTIAVNGDSRSLVEVKPKVVDESMEKSRLWKLTEITEPSQCRSLRLPDNLLAAKVSRLIYTNSGLGILALTSTAIHKLWKWQKNDRNVSGKATASILPQLWQPSSGILMTNEINDANPEEAVHCFALSKNDSYVTSASGGKISLFNMMTFKTMTTFMAPPPAATFLVFYPQDNNFIAIGMDDSSIQIYNVRTDEVKSKLRGHQKRVTGLAFSIVLNILISSGADAQLCTWGTDGWEKRASKFLPLPTGQVSGSLTETRVQFHHDQIHLLVVHETQLAIYEATKLECIKQWVPRDGVITHATYSCDSQMIYASFMDGNVNVFMGANLRLRCRICPTAYLHSQPSSNVYPLVIAAHPSEPNQFALGLTDGGVQVLEPLESEGKWGMPSPENGVGVNASPSQGARNTSDQPS